MSKLFYAALVGVVGALIIHLLILFMLPVYSENSSWRIVRENSEIAVPIDVAEIAATDEQNLFLDPSFLNIICRYDLSEGTMRVSAQGEVQLWTAAVLDTSGAIFFSANDRISTSKDLDLAVVNPTQLRFARQNTPDILANSIVAAASENEGFVLIRIFKPDQSWEPRATEFFDSMQCELLTF